jgi:hypothetical protein
MEVAGLLSGGRSARELRTMPAPARYQPTDAVNAPGRAYAVVSRSSRSSDTVESGPDQCSQKCRR